MCSMVLKETLAYYSTDGGVAFCTFLDATITLDRVEWMNVCIYIAPVKQKSSEALAAE